MSDRMTGQREDGRTGTPRQDADGGEVVDLVLRVAVEDGNVLSVRLGREEVRLTFDTARDAALADGILTMFAKGMNRIFPFVAGVGEPITWKPGEEEPEGYGC